MSSQAGKNFIGVGVGAIILNEKNEVLLLKRSKNARIAAGLWCRPGGEVSFGESASDGVEREVFEETNLRVKVFQNLGYSETIAPDKSQHWISLSFAVKYVSGEIHNNEPDKHDEIRWFPLESLPENLTDYTKESIQKYLARRGSTLSQSFDFLNEEPEIYSMADLNR